MITVKEHTRRPPEKPADPFKLSIWENAA